ncbi:MAG: peptide MFS transporter [Oligoflexia bacterium]|nr:peptide MFS transporter [Oligoflexia bacterium]
MSKRPNRYIPWAGHPPGLPTLFFLEAWERFSYYGMRSILVLFLISTPLKGGFGLSEAQAYLMSAVYTAMVYLTPLFGGWIADRWLKARKTAFLGGIMIMLGHFSLAMQTMFFFKLGLAFLIIGNGLFKPNVSTMVGELYPEGDKRKDGGYSIFYSGINWGAMLGIFLCGFLGQKVSWHLGFGAAGIAMLLGLVVVFRRQYTLELAGLQKGKTALDGGDIAEVVKLAVVCVAVGVLAILALPLLGMVYDPVHAFTGKNTSQMQPQLLFFWRLPLALLLVFVVKFVFRDKTEAVQDQVTGSDTRFYGIGVVLATMAFFVAALALGQTDGVLTVFADQRVNLNIWGWQMPAAWVQNFNPATVVILAPFFARIWERTKINDFGKQSIGLALMALNYWLVGLAFTKSNTMLHASGLAAGADGAPRISILWLMAPYLAMSMGELCTSAIGLAIVQKLSPRRMVNLMMAIYLLGSFAANTIANPILIAYEGREPVLFTLLAKGALIMSAAWFCLSWIVRTFDNQRDALRH